MNLSAKSAMIIDWLAQNTEATVTKPVEELAAMIAADLSITVSAMYLRKLRRHYCTEAKLQLQTTRRGGGGAVKANRFNAMVNMFSDLAERINLLTTRLNRLATDLAEAGITAPYNAAPLPTNPMERPIQPEPEAPFVEEIPAEIVDSVHYHESETAPEKGMTFAEYALHGKPECETPAKVIAPKLPRKPRIRKAKA